MKKISILCASVLAIGAAMTSLATTWYVSPSGDGTDPSAGFATGYATIKAAIANSALDNGDTILLDKCTFDLSYENRANEINGEVTISKSITVSGAGTRDETVLNGGREYSGRYWAGQTILRHSPRFTIAANNVTFQNMTFEKMGSDGSAAILGNNNVTGSVVSNMTFRNTGAGYETWYNNFTAHVYLRGGGAHVSCCVFTNNVFPCAVLEMAGTSGDMSLENCYFANNICDGTKNDNGVVHSGFGVYEGKGLCRNNTIVNNKSKSGALKYSNWGKNRVVNNIIYGNKSIDGTEDKNFFGDGSNYSKLWTCNCLGAGTWTPDTAKGNIFANPGLADDGMHLKAGSLCIGAADKTYATTCDIEGVARDPENPCMGCCEYVGAAGFTCSINALGAPYVSQPDKITLSVTTEGDAVAPLTYAWDLNGDGEADTTEAMPVLSELGEYAVSVSVTDAKGVTASSVYEGKLYVYPVEKAFYVVTENPNAKSPFTTWETAATSINAAHEHAFKFAESKIILGDGVHSIASTVMLTNGMSVVSLNGRDKCAIKYTLYGDVPMFQLDDQDVVLEGISLIGGSKNPWSSIVKVGGGTVRDCVISNFCKKAEGGVIDTYYGSGKFAARIERCVIANNSTWDIGGVVGVRMGNRTTLENCLFKNNVMTNVQTLARAKGAALCSVTGNSIIRNCTFVGNDSLCGMPLHFVAEPTVFENNIVYGNTTNGTFTANDLIQDTYGWHKEGYIRPLTSPRHCCVFPALADYGDREKVITADPKFVAADDCHLDAASPCVNAGTNDNVYTSASVDLDKLPRIVRRKVDLGCYECQKEPGFAVIVR